MESMEVSGHYQFHLVLQLICLDMMLTLNNIQKKKVLPQKNKMLRNELFQKEIKRIQRLQFDNNCAYFWFNP